MGKPAISAEPPKRFSPLFNDAFLRIFGSEDSAPGSRAERWCHGPL